MLGWGIDLGELDSVSAQLFADDAWCDLPHPDVVGWDLYEYTEGDTRLALMLNRSVVIRDTEDPDFSVADFVKVSLGSEGFPVLASQPTKSEIDALIAIVRVSPPGQGHGGT